MDGNGKLLVIIGAVLALNLYTFATDRIQFTYLFFYLFITGVLFFLNSVHSVKYNVAVVIILLPLSILIFSVLYAYDFARAYRYTMFFASFLLIFVFLSRRHEWHQGYFRGISFLTPVIVSATYIGYFFPLPLLWATSSLFSSENQEIRSRLVNAGAQVGITNQTAANGFLISVGLGLLINKLFLGKGSKKLAYFLVILYSIALVMTMKRSFIVAHVICITALFYVNVMAGNIKPSYLFKGMTVFSVAIVIVMLSEPFIPLFDGIISRFIITDSGDFSSGRLRLYAAGFDLFLEKPLIGHGIYSSPLLLANRFGLYGYQQMHNIYIQLLVELGFLGVVIFGLLFVTIYRITYKTFKKSLVWCKDNNVQFVLGCSFYIQTFWLIYGFFGNPLTEHLYLLTYLVVSAIPLYYWKSDKMHYME